MSGKEAVFSLLPLFLETPSSAFSLVSSVIAAAPSFLSREKEERERKEREKRERQRKGERTREKREKKGRASEREYNTFSDQPSSAFS